MYTLVIQSVFPQAALLLLDQNNALVVEQSWESNKDEVKMLPPSIEKLLREKNLDWKDLSKIVSVVGIGNFSATRISVTIANILSMVTEAKLYELCLDEELAPRNLYELVKAKFESRWDPVKLAKPVYRTAPMITPSKKPKFNTK